jgi:hypothetical protein
MFLFRLDNHRSLHLRLYESLIVYDHHILTRGRDYRQRLVVFIGENIIDLHHRG